MAGVGGGQMRRRETREKRQPVDEIINVSETF